MKSALAITLAVCLSSSTISVAAQNGSGPLARAATRAAIRLAADAPGISGGEPVRAGADRPRPLELKWNELPPVIAGQIVEVVVPGGARVRGEVISVRDEALLIDIRRSSDRNAFPKGSASIPRASITEIAVERSRGSWGRNIGTIIGVLSGLVIGGWVAETATDSAGTGIPTFLVIASGMTMSGYYIGKAGDKQSTHIRVVP